MSQTIFVIEGTDGSGKQTQTQKLYERLIAAKVNAVMQSFPNYDSASSGPVKLYLSGELGNSVNALDAFQASALFAVDRFCTLQQLQKNLQPNTVLVFDRYVSSNMLHQSCKINSLPERDHFLDWLDNLEFKTMRLPRPTKTIFLDMPVKSSKTLANNRSLLKSGMKKDIHEADESHLAAAYEAGHYVAKKFGWNVVNCIDESGNLRSIDSIHQEIWNICAQELHLN